MTPEEFAEALQSIGFSYELAHLPLPEIAEGENADGRDYHLVHRRDGRVSVDLPDDRSNKTSTVTWHGEPAILASAAEARAIAFELIKRNKAIYDGS